MNISPKLQQRAVRAGLKKARKEGHALDQAEVLGLKVQVLAAGWRWLLGAAGVFLCVAGYLEWFSKNNAIQGVCGVVGLLFVIFAIAGVRRTLSQIADVAADHAFSQLIDNVVSAIGDAVDL